MDDETRPGSSSPIPAWTQEEEREAEQAHESHPWALTFGQFLDRVQRLYGFQLRYLGTEEDPKILPYVVSPDGSLVGHLPGGLELPDRLDEIATASLCRRLRIPPEDFGLAPEEPWDEEDGPLS